MQKRKPSIGTVSHGTLNPRDLLDTLADELERVDLENEFAELVAEARAVILLDKAGWTDITDSEHASDLLTSVFDALNDCALPYTSFGANEGDGSDFGFWPDMDSVNELPRVNDPGEVEQHKGEDCVFVNDHGNVTVYDADGNVIWDCV